MDEKMMQPEEITSEEVELPQEETDLDTQRQTVFAQDLAAIQAKYPEETAASVEEFGAEFAQLRRNGFDAVRAYEILHIDQIIDKKVHQAVALDRQNRENRQHLSAAAPGRAAVGEEVPTEVYDQYRKFFPDLSSKDIRKHYAKSK